ncbi:MAG: SDR family NAD(P)-dependent oxidoreductase [Thermoplasmata archaeon]|nr:SDR family NAD(P)-dependent oxidoreductase [Thermoplasmata archaeon]
MGDVSGERCAVVTGGAGAIGGVLVRALLDQGASVTVVDNLSSGRLENVGTANAHPKFRFVQADLRDAASIDASFRGATEIWHLAANPDIRRGTAEPKLDLEFGTIATFHVLEAARRHEVGWIGFSSSSVVYGLPTVFPTPEEYGPLLPQSQYGAHKLASEAMISAFCHSYGMTGTIYRFANIIGPGMTHGVIYDFLKKLERDPTRLEVLGDGRQAKSYLWTADCVSGLLLGREKARRPIDVFNLGTETQVSAGEIARKVVAACGGSARIEMTGGERGWIGDIPRQLLSTQKIRALGWTPRLGSEQAVDQAIATLQAELGPH